MIPFAFPVRVLGLYPVGVRYAKFHSEYSQNCDTIGILLLAVRPLICVWYLLATSPTYRDLYMIFWRISFDLSVIRVLSRLDVRAVRSYCGSLKVALANSDSVACGGLEGLV